MFGIPGSCRTRCRIGLAGLLVSATVSLSVPVQARPVAAGGELLVPSSAWLVGEAAPASALSRPSSCVMVNTYDNGFIVRFSGNESGLVAMAIDFRQNAFVRGDNYPVTVAFPDGAFTQFDAAAYDAGTLVFDLRKHPDFVRLVQDADRMVVTLGPVSAGLGLAGISDGVQRVIRCAGGKEDGQPEEGESEDAPSALPAVESESEPVTVTASIEWGRPAKLKAARSGKERSERELSTETPAAPPSPPMVEGSAAPELPPVGMAPEIPPVLAVPPLAPLDQDRTFGFGSSTKARSAVDSLAPPPGTVVPAIPSEPAGSPSIPKQLSQAEPVSGKGITIKEETDLASLPIVWHARDGEELRTVLAQWSEIAGYDFVWEASRSGSVQGNFRFEGSYEDAVAQLLSESGAAAGIRGEIAGADPVQEAIDMRPPIAPAPQINSGWQAIRGTDLRTVLQLWAREAGVELLWDSPIDFPVKNTLNARGSFESALESVLEQYSDDPLRPVGRLHNPSGSGKKFLVIEAFKPS
ncbi:MAG: hypothetical protein EOM26_01860 [Alphaproteobacteria bacterium]|nr:hypothetical protein [Alphaproteobacteria bacterium]